MKYINFIFLNFLFSLFIAFICISYETFPLKYLTLKMINPYIDNCDILYYNNSGLISIKDINHKDYYLFSDEKMHIKDMINHKYDMSWDGCNCFSDTLYLTCMNLEYNYCVNPIKDFDSMSIFNWTSKVMYFDYNGKYQNSVISLYQINIEEEKERLENTFCKVY